MANDLKRRLVDRLKQVGAYAVGIADPHVGFEHALPGQHPLAIWEDARSVVAFAVACSPKGNNTYLGPYAPWEGERVGFVCAAIPGRVAGRPPGRTGGLAIWA